MKQNTDFKLYLITDRHQTGGRPLLDVVHAALDGGVKAVQLREKDLSVRELYLLAVELRSLTIGYNARLIINDRPDIAMAMEADGVHLGAHSLPVAAVRHILGHDKIIGYSAHAVFEAQQAQSDGADFITFSPVYHTPSKVAYGLPCGVNRLGEAVAALNIPVIALGGIKLENIAETLAARVSGIAVISAILSAADPHAASASLLEKIEEND